MGAEALKGHLDVLLLSILGDGPAHGYAIIEELRRRSNGAFDLPEGTVYPALHRLERAGHLSSTWATDAPRKRRVYEITASGWRALNRGKAEWDSFARAMRVALEAST
ncbi:MAG: PadR family transcriptional regulator, regulatory protein PadR [Solirubrobacteraceae bacterium]|jgi:PadR family transcriptional regulator PadR|nr:PadR family transcriptional regulator, regulatory protein PadR [Solirubrobacteraceae bacterium]